MGRYAATHVATVSCHCLKQQYFPTKLAVEDRSFMQTLSWECFTKEKNAQSRRQL